MPMKRIAPARAGIHSISIYHAYKDGMAESKAEYSYTTSYTEDPEFEFDVRDIKVPEDREDLQIQEIKFSEYGDSQRREAEARLSNHLKIIAYGLNTGQIKVDKEHN